MTEKPGKPDDLADSPRDCYCEHKCPLNTIDAERCSPNAIRERAIAYIIQIAQSLTLRELMGILLYIDLSFARQGFIPFFSRGWALREQKDTISFIPDNILSLFSFRNLTTIKVAVDPRRTAVHSSGEVVYMFDREKYEQTFGCGLMDSCPDFLRCVVVDFFIMAGEAVAVLQAGGIEALTNTIFSRMQEGTGMQIIVRKADHHVKASSKSVVTTRSSDHASDLVVVVPQPIYQVMTSTSTRH